MCEGSPTHSTATAIVIERPWRAGARAAKANLWPGVTLSGFAFGLLLAYWYLTPVRETLERLGQLKHETGWAFAVISTAVFGGMLPGLVQRLRPKLRCNMPWSHVWFLTAFWAAKGLEIDFFYRMQAAWFGAGSDGITVFKKVFIDMGVYCPIWAVPTTVLGYAFKDAGFSVARVLAGFYRPERPRGVWPQLRGWLTGSVLPVLISSWAVWVPAVVVIYCLPLALQLPVQNLVLCFWSLLVIWQVRPSSSEPSPTTISTSPITK